ncbi:MAG: GIY-YIG nuclease family protein [Agriterribacter sp.]
MIIAIKTFFVMWMFYILYSPSLDKYYVGHTGDQMEQRLRRHNSNHKGFTGSANDWRVAHIEEFQDKKNAFKREREVKSWKSRERIKRLIATDSEHSGS